MWNLGVFNLLLRNSILFSAVGLRGVRGREVRFREEGLGRLGYRGVRMVRWEVVFVL